MYIGLKLTGWQDIGKVGFRWVVVCVDVPTNAI